MGPTGFGGRNADYSDHTSWDTHTWPQMRRLFGTGELRPWPQGPEQIPRRDHFSLDRVLPPLRDY